MYRLTFDCMRAMGSNLVDVSLLLIFLFVIPLSVEYMLFFVFFFSLSFDVTKTT